MCKDAVIRRIAGIFVIASVALGYWVHPAWFLFTAFVGFNLFQSSLTGFCPLERILGAARLFGCEPKAGAASRIVVLGLLLIGAPAAAQPGGHAHGPGQGMMAMGRDSATRADMQLIHQLVMNHERITRSVTNLPDGVRTVTESEDTVVAALIRQHTRSMERRIAEGRDPGIPMESATVRALFKGYDKVRTTVDSTAKGIVVIQVSDDPTVVALLQQHAAELSDLVRRGMAAMHNGMTHGGMKMPP